MTTGDSITVLLTDDNAVVRMGLRLLLEGDPGIEVVGEAASGQECIDLVDELSPDVVLLDVRMPGSFDGVVTVEAIADRTNVLMFSHDRDSEIVRGALRNGARGYLVHGEAEPDEILSAVKTVSARRRYLSGTAADVVLESAAERPAHRQSPVHAGSLGLTEREAEIMDLVARGRSNTQVAAELFIAPSTLKNHITRIFAKLGVATRAEAMVQWLGSGPGSDQSTGRGASWP